MSKNTMSKSKLYLLFGEQGSGKSTQGKLLSEALKLPYFDAGDQLRALAESETEQGERVRQLMANGQLVDNATLAQLLESFIANNNCQKGLVVDGFPRNIVQAKILDEIVEKHRWLVIGFYIQITDEIAIERLAGRFQMKNGRKVVREDDQPATVKKRLELFKRQTLPVIEYLEKEHQLYRIDGAPSINEVHQSLLKKVND